MADTEVHSDPLTLPGVLRDTAARRPDQEALIDGPVRLTYAQLREAVDRFAQALLARGVRPGDRIGLWGPNQWQWVVAALGIQSTGAILVPVNTRFKGAEAQYVLRRSGAIALVAAHRFLQNDYVRMLAELPAAGPCADAGHAEAPEPLVPSLPAIHTIIAFDTYPGSGVLDWADFDALADDIPRQRVDERIAGIAPDDVADILFTSGTTGAPKGVMTTQVANVVVDRGWADLVGLLPDDRYLLVNPLFHSFGYRAGLIACLLRGATIVLQAVFDVEETIHIVQTEHISVFPGAPAIYTSILDHPGRAGRRLSSVRLVVTGAAVVPVALIERMKSELGFATIITAYGQTETCGTATVCPPDAPIEKIASTSGRAIPGTSLRISGPDGSELPTGEAGEILVRGANVMKGYWQDPAATAAAITPEGWLHTGDVGFLDADGYLTITDRIKDMFTVGGFNVYPAEVEQILVRHPAVSDCAVVGVPDARLGDVGRAYVTLRDGATVTGEELHTWAREQMANFKVPRSFQILPQLPRNAAGKVQKFRLTDVGE
ncbi:acyl-CoA synthetase (AMP-forming)/AMP-acid ligase II [Branchiibius hedensis]|uniref:Acyl-CoA synthetase (AMP-forming)/AMP-acid ligase II n=1 Tax=Branchiibius hedensis TaxID=672460 RepID=A0A2Y8ZUY0_9MICO|nr:FadD3 family acyl-CoA ligase [Branchiibius hedensis]PWJ27043.1 acyl-CoA synthetase (AMP-forming)/AMP-acid ligase II [Branchiibius hedensis]SSA35854.1 Acyl-CoA synthetase (AMP-forming)/AMP-acid ligase II [Branchiibius hedensis]